MKLISARFLSIVVIGALASVAFAQGRTASNPGKTQGPKPGKTQGPDPGNKDKDTSTSGGGGGGRRHNPVSTLQGELTITTNLAGCAVLLNNVPKGTTDASGFLSVRSLKPGQYVVVARKLGYRDETRTINVSAGRSELVPVTLSPLPG
jgi:hypothetical protein